ncbi:MAG: lysostaphin resistance A-like protein [bacterium]
MQDETRHPTLRSAITLLILSYLLAGLVTWISSVYLPKLQFFLGELFIIMPTLVFLHVKKYSLKTAFRFNKISRNLLLVSLVLGCSVTILSAEIDRIISSFIQIPPELEEFLTEILTIESLFDGVVLFLSAVIVASLFEEMLFRGLLQKAFENRMEFIHAIFFTALIFAFLHLTPWLIQVLLLGVLLGLMAWRSNSIVPGIILHMFNNGFALILSNTDPEKINWYSWNGHIHPTVLVIAAGATYYGFKFFFRFTQTD